MLFSLYQTHRGAICMASLARQMLPPNPGAHTLPLNFHLTIAGKKNKLQLSSIFQIAKTAMKRNIHCSYSNHEK